MSDQEKQAVIRIATAADAEGIASVRITSWRQAFKDIIPQSYLNNMSLESSTQLWSQILAASTDAACTFVVEVDHKILGFASGMTVANNPQGFDAELTGVYVLPEIQGEGVGRRLVKKVMTTLAKAGAKNMLTWVLAQNQSARDFLLASGAQQQTEQLFDWDGFELKEVSYGWSTLEID